MSVRGIEKVTYAVVLGIIEELYLGGGRYNDNNEKMGSFETIPQSTPHDTIQNIRLRGSNNPREYDFRQSDWSFYHINPAMILINLKLISKN